MWILSPVMVEIFILEFLRLSAESSGIIAHWSDDGTGFYLLSGETHPDVLPEGTDLEFEIEK